MHLNDIDGANIQIDLLTNPGRPTQMASYKARRRRKRNSRDTSSKNETDRVVFRCFLCLRRITLNRKFSGRLCIIVGGILSQVDGIQAQHFEISLAGHASLGGETIFVVLGESHGDFTSSWNLLAMGAIYRQSSWWNNAKSFLFSGHCQ